MKIRGTDLEILSGSGETLTYFKFTRTYDTNGVLSPRVRAYFDSNDFITMTVKTNIDDVIPVITKYATIIDGNAIISLLGDDTNTLSEGTYIYDIKCVHATDEPYFIVAPSNFEVIKTSESYVEGS